MSKEITEKIICSAVWYAELLISDYGKKIPKSLLLPKNLKDGIVFLRT